MKTISYIFIFLTAIGCEKSSLSLKDMCGIEAPTYWGFESGISNASTNLSHWKDMRCLFRVSPLIDHSGELFSIEMTNWYRPCDKILCKITNLPFLKLDTLTLGEYSSNAPSAYLSIVHGEDATTEGYDLLEGFNNWLVIDGHSSDSTEVWGKYNLAFVISPHSIGGGIYDPTFPDTIFLRNGEFTSRLYVRAPR